MKSDKQGKDGKGPPDLPAEASRAERGITITYLPVPAALLPHVTTMFHFTCDQPELRDMFPAMVGFLSFTLLGQGRIDFAGGYRATTFPVSLLTPTSAAMELGADGPFHAVGAVLSPLGWAALTGLHAARHADRLYDAGDCLGPGIVELGERLREDYRQGRRDPLPMAAAIADYLGGQVKRINPRHIEVMRQVSSWLAVSLDPPVADLFGRCAYSARQVERLVERYYGCPPKMLVRKYRALRVTALLQSPETTPEQAAQLIDLYYDQSHMIRELRHFAGRTPARLADGDTPILKRLTDVRNYRELQPRIAPLPKG